MNHRLPARPFGALLALAIGAAASAAWAAPVAFNRDIRPILSDNCFACHGFDAKKRKAGLRLDTPEGAFAANKDGKVAIKPGDPAASDLWVRLNTADADDVMPPPGDSQAAHRRTEGAGEALDRGGGDLPEALGL